MRILKATNIVNTGKFTKLCAFFFLIEIDLTYSVSARYVSFNFEFSPNIQLVSVIL